MAACLVPVIISSDADLSTSEEKRVQKKLMDNVRENEPELLPVVVTRSTRFLTVHERMSYEINICL
jgi:hypothetical protein